MKKFLTLCVLLLITALTLFGCNNDPTINETESIFETESTSETESTTEPEPSNQYDIAYTLTQVDKTQAFTIGWDADHTITKLHVLVKHGDQTVSDRTFRGALSDGKLTVDAYYGKHTVTLTAYTADGLYNKQTTEIALSADEYIIAPISGSMPQLYFTLYMDEITREHTIPAFVWLARPGSWNWNHLPDNVYPMPTVDVSEVLVHNNYDRMVAATDAYIEELFSIDPAAKFNLYINDYNAYLYLKLMTGNGIPEENYYVTLLSDGGASNAAFNAAFNIDEEGFDADAVYAEMAAKLETLYAEVREAEDYGWTNGSFTVSTSEFNKYAYVCAKEHANVEWWLPRPRANVLCSTDTEFINTVLNVDTVKAPHENRADNIIIERNFANPLTSLSPEQEASLKALYNFSDDMFEAAESQGKKAMMILGSWAKPENEPDFESYVKMVMAYYGDEYVYFYKGHPNTPTALYPNKQAQLEKLGLIDVESSINAELILFFFPDIYMCGYASSTFTSVYSEEMACALFNVSKDTAYSDEAYDAYKHLIGFYATKLDAPAESAYATLCPEADHTYFLMEFNREDMLADIAIYDETAGTITYYNVADDGSFTTVTA